MTAVSEPVRTAVTGGTIVAEAAVDEQKIEALIERWSGLPGGAERKNFAPFIYDLIDALELPRPEPGVAGRLGNYEFEGTVQGGSAKQTGAGGSADLYKRGHFVMEAKQSWLPPRGERAPGLFDDADVIPLGPTGAAYDKLMIRAQAQAKNYAVNLPADHPSVPFLIVCDVGRAFELYYDAAGNGRGYGFYPDAKSYRIPVSRLREPDVQALFRDIWTNPAARDPKLVSAEVTQQVTKRLAAVSQWLEETQRVKTKGLTPREQSLAVEETALFVMRLLFCMFAEDIGLLPEKRFTEFLAESVEDDRNFDNGLHDLWSMMNAAHGSRWSWVMREDVRYFNGGLFEDNKTYPLGRAERGELLAAAKHNWRNVEPAIFGTLLEQALSTEQRAKLGAHYTPRAYVERLVDATIMEVLNAEWAAVQDRLTDPAIDAAESKAIAADFHDRLARVTVLDPACGTGNFLYVAMEAIERLEAQVIEVRRQLGDDARARVAPHQFLGLEKNPRAAKIAELVLWIGWLRFRIRNDPDSITDPVLASAANINFGEHGGYDAVLDEETGLIPAWPQAEFIVGNPPFIGAKYLRGILGDDYTEALWNSNQRVPQSADFVMQWWDRAANLLTMQGSPLKRFGFVTTNSIKQTFSQRVIEGYLGGDAPLSLVLAIPDHPWTKGAKDAAAVRIAMTVAEAGIRNGVLLKVVRETALESDAPKIEMQEMAGAINADLTIGSNVTNASPLKANAGLGYRGVQLMGAGFMATSAEAAHLGLGKREGLEAHIRPYRHGRDLLQRSRGIMVIDLLGLDEKQVRTQFPEVYQHLLVKVKPERDLNRRATYKKNWWIFGEPRREMRPALNNLVRFIATPVTAKHRIFEFLDGSILPDDALIAVGSDEAFHLGVLSSNAHLEWTYARSSLLGVAKFEQGHRYLKSQIFDPFPFPDPTPEQRVAIAEIAEELDATRKRAIAEVDRLTMTELYNLRAGWVAGTLNPTERDRAVKAGAGIVAKLHDDLDAAVAAAFGWEWPLSPDDIVARLVALNAERAAEEAAGQVRWLRPDYQKGRFGTGRS